MCPPPFFRYISTPLEIGSLDMTEHLEAVLAEARACLASNNLPEAARLSRQVLGGYPEVVSAMVILGVSAVLGGAAKEALTLLRIALSLRPEDPAVHHAVSLAFRESGDVAQACHHAMTALQADPHNSKFQKNYAYCLCSAKKLDEAVSIFYDLKAAGDLQIKDRREFVKCLIEMNRLAEAEEELREALEIDPEDPETLFTQAHLLVCQKKSNEVISIYRRVIQLNPKRLMAYVNLAAVAVSGGNAALAARACRAGIAAGGDAMPALYVNYSLALAAMGKAKDAVAALDQAAMLDPLYPKLDGNRLFFKQYLDTYTPDDIYEMHRIWNQRWNHNLPVATAHDNTPIPGRRLRIGYVSPDFRGHSCAFFLRSLFEHHDRENFEIFSYNAWETPDKFTEYFRSKSDVWRDLENASDEAVAAMIRADGIDILVDLAGHSARHRIYVFARKPAPVQVTWLGYPTTTGLDTMDWRLSDDILTPADTPERFSERLYRLPRISHCYSQLDAITPDPAPPPCLKNGYVTFGSFNNFAKISDTTLRLWAAVLRANPGARLRLKSRNIGNDEAADHLVSRYAEAGGDVGCLDMTGGEEYTRNHLARYAEIDIALDTTPYGGMTTSCEAMVMGVPVITLTGDRTASRYTTSLLHALDLRDLAAASAEEFVAIATRLAADRDRLTALRHGLREKMQTSPLGDEAGFTKAVEAAYRDMWSHWCQGHASKA